MSLVVVERRRAARFLCLAAWRCTLCASPWFARVSWQKALSDARAHEAREHGHG